MTVQYRLMVFYFLTILGIVIYLKGFFPVKISSPGYGTLTDVPPAPSDSKVLLELSSEEFPGTEDKPWSPSGSIPQNFTKLVLVVIDAIREDFVFGAEHLHSMPFLHQSMLMGNAASFVSRVQAPTVTTPRIKALTTGSVPGYFEVFLNLDQAKEMSDDSIIRSAFADGRSIVFYGDDTWSRLFPRKFKREEGLSSFMVANSKVDSRLTRHLDTELAHPDNFDILILHYMGLDHIGRTAGSKSKLIDQKLLEMDSVIEKIYATLVTHDRKNSGKSLLVVTGDHGMTDKGSHGGTTMPERNVPLVFLRPGLNKDLKMSEIPAEVDQIDIAVTLSLLLGLPIPKNSVGKPIVPLLQQLHPEDQLHAMQYNCHHLLTLAAFSGTPVDGGVYEIINPLGLYRDALLMHATWLKHVNTASKEFEEAKHSYLMCQQAMSERLTANIAQYNYMYMGMGMVTVWLGYLAVVITWAQAVLSVTPQEGNSAASPSSPITWGVLATVGTILHAVSIVSSSFLEEEHQTWYFLTVTFLTVLFTSILNDIGSKRLGMADSIQKGFFSRSRTPSPQHRSETAEKGGGDLQHRPKRDEGLDASWDFVELELDVGDADPGPRTRTKSSSSDIKTSLVLISCLMAHRLLRSWNQTGIQNASVPDTGDWLNAPDNIQVLSFLFATGLVCLVVLLELLAYGKDPWRRYATWVGLALVYFYRAATFQVVGYSSTAAGSETDVLGLAPARLAYLMVIFMLGRLILAKLQWGVKASDVKTMDYLISTVTLLGALLLRPHNVWALVFNLFLYWSIFRQLWPIMNGGGAKARHSNTQLGKIVLRTTLCYWFGQMAYFSMGNSNSLATIDVSSGYVGISPHASSLEDTIVVLLIIFTTYVGPLIWTMLCLADCVTVTCKDSAGYKSESRRALLAVFSTVAFLRLTPTAFYIILVTAMRHHLFIWSVFAPKLLYETASTVIHGLMLLAASAAARWLH